MRQRGTEQPAARYRQFGLPYLGYTQTAGPNRFGLDVYNSGWNG